MNKYFYLLFFLFTAFSAYAQTDKIQGDISTYDTADLTVLNIFPGSFPNVSVVFKAETRKGVPVWDLTKDKMIVKENAQTCKVVSLEHISKNKPINIGIVMDHSGSMLIDVYQLYDSANKPLFTVDKNNNAIPPDNYVAPIVAARAAVNNFIGSFNFKKDYISIIGFSDSVDKKLPLSQDTLQMREMLFAMQADRSTALYDAINTSIEELQTANGIRIVVVLTDGLDNASKLTNKDVISDAVKNEIPIYIIGLGDADIDVLQMIADSTKGKFYFIDSAKSLNDVYTEISRQIQAFYNLVYFSPNLASADKTRQIELSFDIDSLYLITHDAVLNLPPEVITYLEQKEKRKEYLLYGGIVVVLLLAAGTLLFSYHRKRKATPVIKKVYPNPAYDELNINFSGNEGQLQITDMKGQIVKTLDIHSNTTRVDISGLPNGNYLVVILSKGKRSNMVRIVVGD